MSKALAQLQLPPNFEIVSAAEFLAALQPSRDIQRVGSKVVAIIDTAGRWSLRAYGLYRLRHKPWRGRWAGGGWLHRHAGLGRLRCGVDAGFWSRKPLYFTPGRQGEKYRLRLWGVSCLLRGAWARRFVLPALGSGLTHGLL